MTGVTSTGFSWEIDEEAADDIELLEYISGLDERDIRGLMNLIERLLGKEQKKKLYDHLRTEKGHVPASKVLQTITEIFNTASEENQKIKN